MSNPRRVKSTAAPPRRSLWLAASVLAGATGLGTTGMGLAGLGTSGLGLSGSAHAAQTRTTGPKMNIGAPGKPSDPVTYLADHEQYEKTGLVTWSGNVQVWQGDHALRADKITYDRNTGVMAASGHVAVVDPDGTATYADYLELSNGMHDGIGTAIYMRMEDNAKIAANGMRRTEGKVNDLSHVIYTACQICETNRLLPPFWQIRAYNGTHDVEHHRIEFEHGWLDMLGIPVIYFPVFSMTDPTVKRQSGFLIPGISPHDRYLGTYITIPYFWAIDQQQDLTAQLLVASRTGPQLSGQYRNALNFGNINFTGAIAYDTHGESRYTNTFGNDVGSAGNHGIQGYVRGSAQFAIDDHWRAGLNLNLASSANYMRDYRITGYGNEFLNSTAYLEGFGVGSYTKLDTSFFQGLNQGTIRDSDLPFVLPRLTYDFQGRPDALGGTFSAHTTDFNVYRPTGARDQRGELQMNWDRPFHNKLGQQWLLTLRLDSTLYHGSHLYQQPLFYESSRSHTTGQVLPTIALKLNWPFLRTFAKGHGSQILEPIVQAIYAPNTGYSERDNMPNEDSLGYEFTDSTLFSLNRYLGTDRLDGGLRGNVGIHSNWIWNGHVVDLLVGESLQEHITRNMPAYSGLDHHVSDPVGRIRISPSRFVDLTARGRYNPWKNRMDYGEGLISTGTELFHVNGGYVYEPVTPYYYYARSTPPDVYYKPISELSAGISSRWHEYHVSVFGRRALKRKEFVSLGGDLGYNNDCFGLDIFVIKQYTSIGGQQRNTTVLFNFTFKTIGTFGING